MSNPRLHLGALIRDGRRALEPPLTQDELAEKIHRTQPTVSAWEAGKQIPSLDALDDLATVLGLDFAELVRAASAASGEPVPA